MGDFYFLHLFATMISAVEFPEMNSIYLELKVKVNRLGCLGWPDWLGLYLDNVRYCNSLKIRSGSIPPFVEPRVV